MFRKLFKRKRPKNEAIIDLGKLNEIQNRERILKEAGAIATQEPGSVGFLGTLASAASNESSQISQPSHVAMSGQDIEKLERFGRRLDHLINRLELLERKIERIEHRVDLRY